LLTSIVEWALADGADLVTLWVVDGNEPASKLYERHGFRYTGERQPVPGSVSAVESKLALHLSGCG
jgi:ribosomal protein S18 acetylase RimI-like enzyme